MLRQVVKHAGGVVMVARQGDSGLDFLGSGFLCHTAGYVLTCAHILDLTGKLKIVPTQAIDSYAARTLTQVQTLDVTVAQFDAVNDVALLKLPAGASVSVAGNWIGKGEAIPVGASVGFLGIPFGDKGLHTVKLSASVIAGKSLSPQGSKQLHLDANVHSGNSGGPVVDVQTNQIVGVVAGRFSPTGVSAAVSIGDYALGQDSTISFAAPIEYGVALMKAEGLHV